MDALALGPDRDDRPHEDHFVILRNATRATPLPRAACCPVFLDRPTTSGAIGAYRAFLRNG